MALSKRFSLISRYSILAFYPSAIKLVTSTSTTTTTTTSFNCVTFHICINIYFIIFNVACHAKNVKFKLVLKQIFAFFPRGFSPCKIDAEAGQEISKTLNNFFQFTVKRPYDLM